MRKKYLILTFTCGVLLFFMPLFLVILFFIIGIFSIKYGKGLRILWMAIIVLFLAIFGAIIYYYIDTMPSKEFQMNMQRAQDSLIKIEKNRSKDRLLYKISSDSISECKSHINSQ